MADQSLPVPEHRAHWRDLWAAVPGPPSPFGLRPRCRCLLRVALGLGHASGHAAAAQALPPAMQVLAQCATLSPVSPDLPLATLVTSLAPSLPHRPMEAYPCSEA